MPLINCPECQKRISNQATTCPNCGHPLSWQQPVKQPEKPKTALVSERKPKSLMEKIIWGFVIVMVVCIAGIYGLLAYFKFEEKKPNSVLYQPPKTQEELRQELRQAQIKKYFSGWDGSHLGLTKVIKESMNDPNSYDHVETKYSDKGEFLIVKTTFRGKNAFGGVVINSITAKVDLQGNVIEIISKEP